MPQTSESRHRIFISASPAGFELAAKVSDKLVSVGEPVMWIGTVIGLGPSVLDTLLDSISQCDIAVLLITPADLKKADRSFVLNQTNVIFQLGVFATLKRRDAAILVMPEGTNASEFSDFGLAKVIEYRSVKNHKAILSSIVRAVKQITSHPSPRRLSRPAGTVKRNARRRNTIFISYSREDRVWVERLRMMMAPAMASAGWSLWDDSKIEVGDEWRPSITAALDDAVVAVLLVSPQFLQSPFITTVELPKLLRSAARGGTKVVWVPVAPSLYEFSDIAKFKAALDPEVPLVKTARGRQGEALKTVAKAILSAHSQASARLNRGRRLRGTS